VGEQRVVIRDGKAEFIYSDDLARALAQAGPMQTRRASHVEPHPTRPGWLADMRPSDGPILGRYAVALGDGESSLAEVEPFGTRQQAIDAELAWLREHRGL
jgi:hypothetical protein